MMHQDSSYTHIFSPIKIGPLWSKNRMEVSPAENHMASALGHVTQEFTAFTATLAQSGAGIVTIGDSPVTQSYHERCPFTLNMADPLVVNGLVGLVEGIHRFDSLASIELNLRDEERLPADYTVREIEGIIQAFADAAFRAKQAGFDMVMIHSGHGHVVDQFFHPFFNTRTDEYGAATLEGRCRFAKSLVRAVREAIGPEMAIELRMSGDEKLDAPGMSVREMAEFALRMQDNVDLLHVSAGNLYDMHAGDYMIQGQYMPRATNVAFASYIKKRVSIPVVSVGKFTVPLAEHHIASGDCDMVAMIRGFISDPECLKKAKAGRDEDIRPCLRCNQCTGGGPGTVPKPTRCGVNPRIGRELAFPKDEKASVSKRVAVVGGGAAGLEAARWLAQRGHIPTIFERRAFLGGNLVAASKNVLKQDVADYLEWSVRSVRNDPRIDVRLSCEASPQMLAEFNPDAVVLAIGATPIVPDVPGVDLPNVVYAADVDERPGIVASSAVIVGSGLTGLETALALRMAGKAVTVVVRRTREALIAEQGMNLAKAVMYCDDAGVDFAEKATLVECCERGALVRLEDGDVRLLEADAVILSLGLRPRSEEVDSLMGVVDETFVIGDCKGPRDINSAVREAYFAAMAI